MFQAKDDSLQYFINNLVQSKNWEGTSNNNNVYKIYNLQHQ